MTDIKFEIIDKPELPVAPAAPTTLAPVAWMNIVTEEIVADDGHGTMSGTRIPLDAAAIIAAKD